MWPGQAANTSVRRGRRPAKCRARCTKPTPPFSSTKPWPSVCVLKMIVSLLAPGRTAVTAGVGTVVRVALSVSRDCGRVPACARSFAPASRSTYRAGTSSFCHSNGMYWPASASYEQSRISTTPATPIAANSPSGMARPGCSQRRL